MKGLAALLLSVVLASSVANVSSTITEAGAADKNGMISNSIQESTGTRADDVPSSTEKLPDYAQPAVGVKEILLQEIRTLDKEAIDEKDKFDDTDDKIPEIEVAKAFKAQAEKSRMATVPLLPKVSKNGTMYSKNVKKLLDAMAYDEDLSADEEEEDEDDDEYDYENEDALDDDEEDMTQCPDYCRCYGQYVAATTAACSKFIDAQSFGPGISHLKIENAGEIRLGPHSLRSRGLQQLETITITDTKILELDRTAFDGLPYLFAINLTRNGLQDLHPQLFQNNTQLSLLTISGNPLRHAQYYKTKHYLLDAPKVTDFDFSNNGISRLPRTAFAKMPGVNYVNLRGNKLKELENTTFSLPPSLEELDLSYNMINELPADLFKNTALQTLRLIGNNLTTIATIKSPKLTSLDVSNNRIKIIGKDDLAGIPLLDDLRIKSNGLKRIHHHAFAKHEQLTYLDISDNKLSWLIDHHFKNNQRLQVLIMSDNPDLETLPVFKSSGEVYDTYSIYRLDCANCDLYFLEKGTFDALPALVHLNLARNHLSSLPNGLLSNLSSLRELDLSDNIIPSIDQDMFQGATSLTKLSLAGNPLVTLQVAPFLNTPSLDKLDVSRCVLIRIWSEARVPLQSLKFLSVRGNLLRRITVEELRATPKLSGLDLSHNPFDCDDEFSEAVQYLTDHGITPTEKSKLISNYANVKQYSDADGISQWTDLAKVVCANTNDGPATRPPPHKPTSSLSTFDTTDDPDILLRTNIDSDEALLTLQFDHGIQQGDDVMNAWLGQEQEYEDFAHSRTIQCRPEDWCSGSLWPVIAIIIATLVVLLLVAHVAVCLAKRRGRGPVIRPPMILRQGLVDNKNCGLVYKPLQEEIATPHMPKRGSFYSSSTFHYDKIVPESV